MSILCAFQYVYLILAVMVLWTVFLLDAGIPCKVLECIFSLAAV